jgi:hypothetical protein
MNSPRRTIAVVRLRKRVTDLPKHPVFLPAAIKSRCLDTKVFFFIAGRDSLPFKIGRSVHVSPQQSSLVP